MRNWMLTNELKINDEKTEFILLGSKGMLGKCDINSITVGNSDIERVETVRNLGVHFEKNMNLDNQIDIICNKANAQLYKLRNIRRYLNNDVCITLIHAFVTSHLDYCNALMYNMPKSQILKLQKIQNHAARIVSKTPKHHHITEVLFNLHWLPIVYRIKFKMCLLVFKCLNGMAPDYLSNMLVKKSPTRVLRSNKQCNDLVVPLIKNNFASKSFSYGGPKEWYSLPLSLKLQNNIKKFKDQLKTFYFRQAYDGTKCVSDMYF